MNPQNVIAIDVMSMYESGSAVISMEAVLKMITFTIVIVTLFYDSDRDRKHSQINNSGTYRRDRNNAGHRNAEKPGTSDFSP